MDVYFLKINPSLFPLLNTFLKVINKVKNIAREISTLGAIGRKMLAIKIFRPGQKKLNGTPWKMIIISLIGFYFDIPFMSGLETWVLCPIRHNFLLHTCERFLHTCFQRRDEMFVLTEV